jgi:type II secretory pathway component GspD/PulD (secretin)
MKQWNYFIREGVVYISSKERIDQEQMEIRWYSILDLTIPIIDFPSTEMSAGGGIQPEAGDTGTVQMPAISGEELVKLIQETTAKQEGGWEKASVAFQQNTGVLVVTHVPKVHKQIEELLNQIRAAADVVVTVEARFLSVQQNFLEDIGVDLRGLANTLPNSFQSPPPDGPGFTDLSAGVAGVYASGRRSLTARVQNFITNSDPYSRFIRDERISPIGGAAMSYSVLGQTSFQALLTAVQKDIRTTEVFAPKITIANGQRAHIQMTDQFTYIKDYDVVIVNAGSSIAMGEPIVETFRTGVVLDVRPVVSADLKYIMLELRPSLSVSETRLPTMRTVPFLIGNTNTPIQQIELPEVKVQRARGNAIIPDGGILLMSGYSSGKDVMASSGVPVLSNIPILSFMFGRKAKGEARKNLIILIKAKISILSEEEKKKF